MVDAKAGLGAGDAHERQLALHGKLLQSLRGQDMERAKLQAFGAVEPGDADGPVGVERFVAIVGSLHDELARKLGIPEAINNDVEVLASWARDAHILPGIRLELGIKPREEFVNCSSRVENGKGSTVDGSLASGYLDVSSSVGVIGTLANPSATMQIL